MLNHFFPPPFKINETEIIIPEVNDDSSTAEYASSDEDHEEVDGMAAGEM